jgi:hypothetical protein
VDFYVSFSTDKIAVRHAKDRNGDAAVSRSHAIHGLVYDRRTHKIATDTNRHQQTLAWTRLPRSTRYPRSSLSQRPWRVYQTRPFSVGGLTLALVKAAASAFRARIDVDRRHGQWPCFGCRLFVLCMPLFPCSHAWLETLALTAIVTGR